jgi:hypothetical protein
MDRQDAITPDPAYYLTAGTRLSAKERLAIYVDDYWARCIHTLAEDFEPLEHLWGHAKFHSLVEDYLLVYPSRSYSLRNLGANLLEFVQAQYQGQDKKLVSDIIRYEWAKIEAFDNPVLEPFDPLQLNKAQREGLWALRLRFQPHVTLLALDYPVYGFSDKLRLQHKASKPKKIPAPLAGECYTVVYQRDVSVYHKEIEKPFYLLLAELGAGSSLSEACDKILPVLSPKEVKQLEVKAQAWFQSCVANKWFCAHERDEKIH